MYRTLGYCKAGDDEALVQYLLDAVKNLAACGADFAVLTANTVHSVFDRLSALSPIPLVSIVDAVCDEAFRCGYRKIGLLGTIYTMNGSFFKKMFDAHKIELVTPSENEKNLVNSRIADELELGIVKDSTVRELVSVIQGMSIFANTRRIVSALGIPFARTIYFFNTFILSSAYKCIDSMLLYPQSSSKNTIISISTRLCIFASVYPAVFNCFQRFF